MITIICLGSLALASVYGTLKSSKGSHIGDGFATIFFGLISLFLICAALAAFILGDGIGVFICGGVVLLFVVAMIKVKNS
jgi:hypothetical protein